MFQVLLAAHHGVFAMGPTLSVAFDHAYFVEIAAKIQLEWLKLPQEIRRTIPDNEAQLQRLANWSSVLIQKPGIKTEQKYDENWCEILQNR